MSSFQDTTEDFQAAVQKLAGIWRAESDEWNDAKTKELSQKVLLPIFAACRKAVDRAAPVDRALMKLERYGLIERG
jgi:hypothetical protein